MIKNVLIIISASDTSQKMGIGGNNFVIAAYLFASEL